MFCWHQWDKAKDGVQTCKDCGVSRAVACAHTWGKVEEGYQYCSKCNTARQVDNDMCRHKWETIKSNPVVVVKDHSMTQEELNKYPADYHKYTQKCTKCGEIRTVTNKLPGAKYSGKTKR